jgi:hypothetical protein
MLTQATGGVMLFTCRIRRTVVALPQSFGNNPESPENSLTIDIRNAN